MSEQASLTSSAQKKVAIAKTLEMDIIFGRLRPLERLIEDDLMARFAQSRHRVRCAIDTLANRGLVIRETNKGAHVCGYTGTDIRQLYELRKILHDAAFRMISFPVDPQLLDKLRALAAAHSAAVNRGDLEDIFNINNRFRRTMFSSCGNPVLAETIEAQARRTYPIRTHTYGRKGYLLAALDDHQRMITALEGGDVEALIELNHTHISRPMRDYLTQYNL